MSVNDDRLVLVESSIDEATYMDICYSLDFLAPENLIIRGFEDSEG